MKLMLSLLLPLSLLLTPATAQQADELLEPEQAFAFSATLASPAAIEAVWTIAPGYYMYRDKFDFTANSGGVAIGEPVYPHGKSKQDEFFGAVETFEGIVRITVPLERTTNDVDQVVLSVAGQGCNEPVGVCYPPLNHTVTLTLPSVSAAAAIPAATGSVSELQKLLGIASGEPEFLHPDEAFRLAIGPQDATTLVARFQVAPGYYLYREKLDFTAGAGAILSPLTLPPGQPKRDEYFGEVLIYPEDFNIHLPLMRVDNTGQITIIARYQGCAEQGLCYPPVEKAFTLSLPALVADAQAAATADSPPAASVALIAYLVAAFGTGLLLSFTPCVLPLIPILASSIVGQAGADRTRGVILSLAYVLGTAATYAVIGAVAGATGEQLQAYFQNIWAISAIAVILALMALSMFGLYQLQMPAILQSRLSEGSARLGGSLGMTFVLGAVSALIVGACVSPLLISVLGIAILKGDPWLGAALMFAMALGMGVILVAVGAGAGFLVPRAGVWMERVKQVFGVLLLGVAVYLLGVVPVVPVLLLWSALLIITGVYLGATQAVPAGASGWRYLTKGIGTLLLVWGVLAMIGGFSGNRDILKPVSWQNLATPRGTASPGTPATALHFSRVHNLPALDAELAAARASGQPVLLDYYADWCSDCLRMEQTTFQDPLVIQALAPYRLLQVDVTDPADPASRALKQRYGVFGPPAMLFFNTVGTELTAARLYGYRAPAEFVAQLPAL